MYPAGTTLKLDFGSFFHYGISDGLGNVIHNSKRHMKVVSEPVDRFADGKPILVSSISGTNLPQAAQTARRYIGMPYDLIQSNCEHFARLCHGLEIESTQLQQYLIAALGAGIAAKGNNKVLQVAGGAAAIASLLTPSEDSPFQNAAVAALVAAGLVLLFSE